MLSLDSRQVRQLSRTSDALPKPVSSDDVKLPRRMFQKSRQDNRNLSFSSLDRSVAKQRFNQQMGQASGRATPRGDGAEDCLSVTIAVTRSSEKAAIFDAFAMCTAAEARPFHLQKTCVEAGSVKSLAMQDGADFDCIVCPLATPFGLDDSRLSKELQNILSSELPMMVADRIADDFCGEMTSGSTILLKCPYSKKKRKGVVYVVLVCLGASSEAALPENYVYTATRSALVAIDRHNRTILENGPRTPMRSPRSEKVGEETTIRTVLLPVIPRVGPLERLTNSAREVARQMLMAFNTASIFIFASLRSWAARDRVNLTPNQRSCRRSSQALLSAEDRQEACKDGLHDLMMMGKPQMMVQRSFSNAEEVRTLVKMASSPGSINKKAQRAAFEAICIMLRASSWTNCGGGVTRDRLVEEVLGDVDVFMRLRSLDSPLYLDRVDSAEDIELGEKLGIGGTSVVKQALWQGQEVAIKLFREDQEEDTFFKELAASSLLSHTNIIPTLAYGFKKNVRGRDVPFLLMPLKTSSLYSVLHQQKVTLDRVAALRIASQIADALCYLHQRSLIHRDLKSANVLLDEGMNAALTDFGSTRVADAHMTNMVGTLAWMAPEVLEEVNYTLKADVYSFGMIMYELFTGLEPFEGIHSFSIPLEVMKGTRPAFPKDLPKPFCRLVKSCWAASPAKRPSIEKVARVLAELGGDAS